MNKKKSLKSKKMKATTIEIKVTTIIVISLLSMILLVRGTPTKIDDYFEQFLKEKDIYVVLIGTLISNMFTNNVQAITNNMIIPGLSLILKTDLNKPILYNGIKFNIDKIISSLINLIISVLIIIIIFRTKLKSFTS